MLRHILTTKNKIPLFLCLQLVPLVLFPVSSFTLNSQEIWLPLLLGGFMLVALVQLLLLKNTEAWPWYLASFSQGINIISRLMTLFPRASTGGHDGGMVFNQTYVLLALVAVAVSGFNIWYLELPEVRQNLASRPGK